MAKVNLVHGHMSKHGYGKDDAGMSVGGKCIAPSPTQGKDSSKGQTGGAGSAFGVAKSPTKGKNA